MIQPNIELPFPSVSHLKPQNEARVKRCVEDKMLYESNTFMPPFVHGGKWWARFSAQIWLEVSGFPRLLYTLVHYCVSLPFIKLDLRF